MFPLFIHSTPRNINSPACPEPTHNPLDVSIAVFLLLGMFVSYLPQHYKIISTKSSEGFSPWYLLLGAVATSSNLLNITMLQWPLIQCCRVLSNSDCAENMLSIAQIAVQWVMFVGIFVLYVIYFPASRKRVHPISHLYLSVPPPPLLSFEWRTTLVVAATISLHFFIAVFLSVVVLVKFGVGSEQVEWMAGVWGLISMALATVQYLPQIFWTWKMKTVGALSIPMMMMQTPGSLLLVYSLSIRPGTNWTSWISFLVTGMLQGILLCMCIVWSFKDNARRQREAELESAMLRANGSPGSFTYGSMDVRSYAPVGPVLVGVGVGRRKGDGLLNDSTNERANGVGDEGATEYDSLMGNGRSYHSVGDRIARLFGGGTRTVAAQRNRANVDHVTNTPNAVPIEDEG